MGWLSLLIVFVGQTKLRQESVAQTRRENLQKIIHKAREDLTAAALAMDSLASLASTPSDMETACQSLAADAQRVIDAIVLARQRSARHDLEPLCGVRPFLTAGTKVQLWPLQGQAERSHWYHCWG